MKARITALLTLGLALLCGCALAFDLSPYELVADSTVCPLSRDAYVQVVSDENAHQITLHTPAGVTRVGQRAAGGDVLSPFVLSGGTIGFFRTEAVIGNGTQRQLILWRSDGTFAEPVALDQELKSLSSAGEAIAGYADGVLHILDPRGRETGAVRVTDGERASSYLNTFAANGDGYLAAVFAEDRREGVCGVDIISIDGDGRRIWQTYLPDNANNTYGALTGDGTGGAYFMKADDSDYKVGRLFALDGSGTPRWEKTIAFDGLILSRALLGWDGEAVTVDACGVSKSKGVYDVVHLRISPEGELISATAKDFSCRPDYSFALRRAADGTIFAESSAGYLETRGTKHVLVPADALPDIAAPKVIVE